MSISETLAERGARYGDFSIHAAIAQSIMREMRAAQGWERLSADKKQALTVIADKIARILSGDPEYRDNWHAIQGYAKLAEDRCRTDSFRVAAEKALVSCFPQETIDWTKPIEMMDGTPLRRAGPENEGEYAISREDGRRFPSGHRKAYRKLNGDPTDGEKTSGGDTFQIRNTPEPYMARGGDA